MQESRLFRGKQELRLYVRCFLGLSNFAQYFQLSMCTQYPGYASVSPRAV